MNCPHRFMHQNPECIKDHCHAYTLRTRNTIKDSHKPVLEQIKQPYCNLLQKTLETEVKADEEKKADPVEDNIALLRYEKTVLMDENKKLKETINDLTIELQKAKDYIDQDTVIGLVKDIAHRTTVPEEMLLLKSVDELQEMKKVLDGAKLSFKSSASIAVSDKSPEARLNSVFDEYAAKTWRKE